MQGFKKYKFVTQQMSCSLHFCVMQCLSGLKKHFQCFYWVSGCGLNLGSLENYYLVGFQDFSQP